MISVESHSKQVKLLNDYIAALEKQINSSRKELDEFQKQNLVNGDDFQRITDELKKEKNDNAQLRYHMYKQDEQLRRLSGLEKEYYSMRDQMESERTNRKAIEQQYLKIKKELDTIELKIQSY